MIPHFIYNLINKLTYATTERMWFIYIHRKSRHKNRMNTACLKITPYAEVILISRTPQRPLK